MDQTSAATADDDSAPSVDDSFLQVAQWPASLPPPSVEVILSVVCGNSKLKWARHTGADYGFAFDLCWRTQHPKPGDTLSMHIPQEVKDLVFGKPENHGARKVKFTSETAAAYRVTQRVPALYVYVVSSNPKNAQSLAKLFQGIPCNVYLLSADDFCGIDDSTVIYKGMGVDRVANVAGAKKLHAPNAQSACLVIDGGTAMTYTATTVSDDNKMQLSGGIGPGLGMKLKALHESTCNLPLVEFKSLHSLIKNLESMIEQCQKNQKPLPSFLTHTENKEVNKSVVERSIAGFVLRETALLLCYVIKDWLSKCPKDTQHALPTVILTGGDSDILEKLLGPEHSYIVDITEENRTLLNGGQVLEFEPIGNSDSNKLFRIGNDRRLIHRAIQAVLSTKYMLFTKQVRDNEKGIADVVRFQLLGQRVAVPDPASATDESKCLYGTIVSMIRSETLDDDYYSVFYEKHDATDDLSVTDVYDALLRYVKTPEHLNVKAEERKTGLANKAKDAEEAAEFLKEKSIAVQNLIELRKLKKRPAPSPADAVDNGDKTEQDQAAKKTKSDESTTVTADDSTTVTAVTTDNAKFVNESTTVTAATTDNAKFVNESTTVPAVMVGKRKFDESTTVPAVTATESTTLKNGFDPHSWIGRRIAKYFGDELYYGTIREFRPAADNEEKVDFWNVVYDDGDLEDLEKHEIEECCGLYQKHGEGSDPQQ